METIKNEKIYVCDKCGKELNGWEDNFASGEISILHSSVIDNIFSEGAGKTDISEQRDYFESHKAVSFGKNPHQSLVLKYGGDTDYQLCWRCSRRFVLLLGRFFKTRNGV